MNCRCFIILRSCYFKSYSEMEVLEAREFQAKTLAESTYCYDFKGDISDLKVPSQEVKGMTKTKYSLHLVRDFGLS